MHTIYQHARFDGPVVLTSHQALQDTHIIQGGARFGYVLFTEDSPMVRADGQNITIMGCYFEGLSLQAPPPNLWHRWLNRRWQARMVAIEIPEGTRYTRTRYTLAP